MDQILGGLDGRIETIASYYYNDAGKVIKDRIFTNLPENETEIDPNRQFVQDGILHTIAPNIYPTIWLSIVNSLEFRSRSERFRDNTAGFIFSIAGGFVMYFVAYICIFRKWRESSSQTCVEYLDR